MAPKHLEELLSRVPQSRRTFLKKTIAAAFAAPVLVTYRMAAASHVQLGVPAGTCCASNPINFICNVPTFASIGTPVFNPEPDACCRAAIQSMRDLNVKLFIPTELAADVAATAVPDRTKLATSIASAIKAVGQGVVAGGGDCRGAKKNLKSYKSAVKALQSYRKTLIKLGIDSGGTLQAEADAQISALEGIINAAC
jgi:hypothetical protein